jgi:hypothetical protein
VKRNGEWVAVPMCSMNQQTWSEVYDGRMNDPELLKEPQVFNREQTAAALEVQRIKEGRFPNRPSKNGGLEAAAPCFGQPPYNKSRTQFIARR